MSPDGVRMEKAKPKVDCLGRLMGRLNGLYERRPVIFSAALAALLVLALEMLGRHSPVQGALFLFTHPVNFLVNALIILTSLALCRLFHRRGYFVSLAAALWLLLGVANAVVRCFRSTPLEAVDISILPSAITVVDVYIDTWLIVVLAALLLAGLGALVYAFFKAKKYEPHYKQAAALVLACASLTALGYGATVWGQEERAEIYANIMDAYDHYGFVYCFCTGAVDRGIDEPDLYSHANVDRLVKSLEPGAVPEVEPDIVMVQLESFFDVYRLDDVTCEGDPIPVFRELKENYSSGFLTVPSVGAGTANTELGAVRHESGFLWPGGVPLHDHPPGGGLRDRGHGPEGPGLYRPRRPQQHRHLLHAQQGLRPAGL